MAALTLAGAAASAELVLRLAARRKSLSSQRPEIERLLESVTKDRRFFEAALDLDVAAFAALVGAQKAAKELQSSAPECAGAMLQDAYVQAAEAPLALGGRALHFLMNVERGLEYASKFTMSDIGAAAVLARGAVDAALLTVSANLAYVEEERARPLRARQLEVREETARISERVWSRATALITGSTGGN